MARTAEDILKEAILLETRGKAFYKNVTLKNMPLSSLMRLRKIRKKQ